MENRTHALAAGAFLLCFIVALGLAVRWLDDRGQPKALYDLVTSQPVNKLDVHADVQFQGIVVGHVQAIGFDPAYPGTALIRIRIAADTPVTRDTYAELLYEGLAATPYVLLIAPDPTSPRLATQADHPARIAILPTGLDETGQTVQIAMVHLKQMVAALDRLLALGSHGDLSQTVANLQAAGQGVQQMEALLTPALQQMSGSAVQARAILAQAHRLEEDIGHLDTSMRKRQATLQSLRQAGQAARALQASLAHTLQAQTAPRLEAAARAAAGVRGPGRRSDEAGRGQDPGEHGFPATSR